MGATSAYQSLYESSVAFGMRKALQAEQRRNTHNKLIKQLQQEIRDLQQEVDSVQNRIVQIETREADRREAEERKHEALLSAPKKVRRKAHIRDTAPLTPCVFWCLL